MTGATLAEDSRTAAAGASGGAQTRFAVATDDLQPGMWVAELDRPWLDTPFLLQGFLIGSQIELATLRRHCRFVHVDLDRSSPALHEEIRGAELAPGDLALIEHAAHAVPTPLIVLSAPPVRRNARALKARADVTISDETRERFGELIRTIALGRAEPRILDTYDAERRPHARAMIRLAKLMGRLVMPRNAALAYATHGLMRALRCVPVLRAQLEELRIKPKNAFRTGLFVRGRSGAKLTRGATLAQGWLRGADGTARLSDDVLGNGYTLVGFGCDPRVGLTADAATALAGAGGTIVQIAQRGQRPDRGGRTRSTGPRGDGR